MSYPLVVRRDARRGSPVNRLDKIAAFFRKRSDA